LRGYDSVLTDGFLDLGLQWLSTAQLDVPHYGLVVGIELSVSAGPAFGGAPEVYYSLQFKNPL